MIISNDGSLDYAMTQAEKPPVVTIDAIDDVIKRKQLYAGQRPILWRAILRAASWEEELASKGSRPNKSLEGLVVSPEELSAQALKRLIDNGRIGEIHGIGPERVEILSEATNEILARKSLLINPSRRAILTQVKPKVRDLCVYTKCRVTPGFLYTLDYAYSNN